MRRLLLLLFVLSFVFTAKAQPPARILFNSSFEEPVNNCPTTRCYRFVNENLVPGWDVANPLDPVVEFWRKEPGPTGRGFNDVLPQDGQQHIELNANRPSDVYLDVCLLNAETVTLVFHHRARGGANTLNTMELEALNQVAGTIEITNVTATSALDTYGTAWAGVGTINVPAAPTNNFRVTSPTTGWTRYSADLTNTGSSGTCRIIFRGITGGSSANFIDNVIIGGLNPLTEFSATGYSDYETSGGNMPRIIINGRVDPPLPGDPPASVQIRIQNGGTGNPATHPADYSTVGIVTVIIPAGDYNGTAAQGISIPLGIVNDNDIEPTEDIRLSYVLGSEVGNIRIADADCNTTEILTTAYLILDDDNPLPVTFTEWKLDDKECGKVELNWTTAQELNSDYFEVQFSEAGHDWKNIGKLTAKGTSSNTNEYSFVHQTDYKSGYYRLKQVDFNGDSKLTHVISSTQDCDKESNYFKFYPNPKSSNQDLTLEFYSTATSLNYMILDALGREIKTNTISTTSNQFIKQNIQENLSKGLYLVKFWQDGKEIYQTKLIVQ
jgi:hypothetical protein